MQKVMQKLRHAVMNVTSNRYRALNPNARLSKPIEPKAYNDTARKKWTDVIMDACDSKPTRVNEHAIHAMCLQVIPRGQEGASMYSSGSWSSPLHQAMVVLYCKLTVKNTIPSAENQRSIRCSVQQDLLTIQWLPCPTIDACMPAICRMHTLWCADIEVLNFRQAS